VNTEEVDLPQEPPLRIVGKPIAKAKERQRRHGHDEQVLEKVVGTVLGLDSASFNHHVPYLEKEYHD